MRACEKETRWSDLKVKKHAIVMGLTPVPRSWQTETTYFSFHLTSLKFTILISLLPQMHDAFDIADPI